MVVLVSTLNIQVGFPSFFFLITYSSVTHYIIYVGVDGHTVLRYVSDIYTETILRFAKTINSQTKSIFHSYKPSSSNSRGGSTSSNDRVIDINPRKIEWNMTDKLRLGIRFAETRLSDLILQNEVEVLEFSKYGKYFITDMKMSPDAFVQVSSVIIKIILIII
jgi:carnitine O-acetyltransferase